MNIRLVDCSYNVEGKNLDALRKAKMTNKCQKQQDCTAAKQAVTGKQTKS